VVQKHIKRNNPISLFSAFVKEDRLKAGESFVISC
jgi:hypothetical protein